MKYKLNRSQIYNKFSSVVAKMTDSDLFLNSNLSNNYILNSSVNSALLDIDNRLSNLHINDPYYEYDWSELKAILSNIIVLFGGN